MKKNIEKKWVIVQIKPNSYNMAVRNLERQGFETFVPKMKVTTRKENRFIYKDAYVFLGYMFVCVDVQRGNWTKIKNTYGVSKLLVFNNKPCVISHEIIMELKDRYEVNITPSYKETYKKGDFVKFRGGPFFDLIAKIEEFGNKNSIYVLLEFMGSYKKLKLNLNKNMNLIKV